ncbi:MAG: hypothetical protein QGF46_04890 [Planctomycetota bacterium]|nr:hypothetical protein [Planctomycetota bacterium]
MKFLITLSLLFVGACSSSISDVDMTGETATGLDYELALMDSTVKGSVQLVNVASRRQGDMYVVEFQLHNADSLGEKRIITSWEWRDANGMSVGLDGTAQQARKHAIDSQGYLTINNSSPSSNVASVILRIRSQQ